MKKLLSIMTLALLLVAVLPAVLAADVGVGITPDIETEDFPPQVWMCDYRIVWDDETEPGRLEKERLERCLEVSSYEICAQQLWERMNNYAFEGEQIAWNVLVFDKNGIEKVEDVFATIGDVQGEGNDIEVNCILDQMISDETEIDQSCNARILEEELTQLPDNTAAYYTCILTVETPESMYGEYWVTVEAVDLDGLSGTMDENEYWFFNPIIALSIDGDMVFENVRPGSSAYSDTILVGNAADDGSGVRMDMFISGTDFYDSSSSGAKCPVSNQLVLGDGDSQCDLGTWFGGNSGSNQGFGDPFCYFATHGAYSTQTDPRNDAEGYVGIDYGIGFNNPNPFYDGYEILQTFPKNGPYYQSNILSPGSEVALTFRLNLPEPCNGDFDSGSIYFWGEAI